MDIKSELISFAEEWLKSNNVPIRRIKLPCCDYSWLDYGLRSAIMNDYAYEFFQRYFESMEENTIYNLSDAFGCLYTTLVLPNTEERLVCGPVLLDDSVFSCPEVAAKRLRLPPQVIPILQDYYVHFAMLHFPIVYSNFFRTLGNYIWEPNLVQIVSDTLNDIEYWYEMYQQDYNPSESSAEKLRISEERCNLEIQFIDALSKADEPVTQEILSKLETISVPLRLDDDLRDKKDFMIEGNTLCRKAAQAAGVHPALVDACSSRHIQMIEQVANKEECRILFVQFIHNYCNLISQHSLRKYSLLTKKMLTYINWDLTSDLRLSTMSERLNVSAGYLSSLFKREVGVPLTDYVNGLRIEQAKKLLCVSDLPVKTIAQKCGIPDIYYFSRQFKKRTGYTPNAYRKHLQTHFNEWE